MRKVCGTCIFAVDSKTGKPGINVLCAHDNNWHVDRSEGCSKWRETTTGLSKKDKIDLASKLKEDENTERRHQELLKDTLVNRKTQIELVILAALLGILGTLVSQYIWSLWFG